MRLPYGSDMRPWHTFWWNRADIPAFAEADAVVRAYLRKHLVAGEW